MAFRADADVVIAAGIGVEIVKEVAHDLDMLGVGELNAAATGNAQVGPVNARDFEVLDPHVADEIGAAVRPREAKPGGDRIDRRIARRQHRMRRIEPRVGIDQTLVGHVQPLEGDIVARRAAFLDRHPAIIPRINDDCIARLRRVRRVLDRQPRGGQRAWIAVAGLGMLLIDVVKVGERGGGERGIAGERLVVGHVLRTRANVIRRRRVQTGEEHAMRQHPRGADHRQPAVVRASPVLHLRRASLIRLPHNLSRVRGDVGRLHVGDNRRRDIRGENVETDHHIVGVGVPHRIQTFDVVGVRVLTFQTGDEVSVRDAARCGKGNGHTGISHPGNRRVAARGSLVGGEGKRSLCGAARQSAGRRSRKTDRRDRVRATCFIRTHIPAAAAHLPVDVVGNRLLRIERQIKAVVARSGVGSRQMKVLARPVHKGKSLVPARVQTGSRRIRRGIEVAACSETAVKIGTRRVGQIVPRQDAPAAPQSKTGHNVDDGVVEGDHRPRPIHDAGRTACHAHIIDDVVPHLDHAPAVVIVQTVAGRGAVAVNKIVAEVDLAHARVRVGPQVNDRPAVRRSGVKLHPLHPQIGHGDIQQHAGCIRARQAVARSGDAGVPRFGRGVDANVMRGVGRPPADRDARRIRLRPRPFDARHGDLVLADQIAIRQTAISGLPSSQRGVTRIRPAVSAARLADHGNRFLCRRLRHRPHRQPPRQRQHQQHNPHAKPFAGLHPRPP